MPNALRVTWDSKKFNENKKEWIEDKSWYNGIHTKVQILLQTKHDLTTNTFYFHILGTSSFKDILIKDTHVIKNIPEFKSLDDEIDFYEYLRCILNITISDIRLLVDQIYVCGPSGIINHNKNIDKNEAEIYQLKNRDKYYNTKYTKFLNIVNDMIYMKDIINNESINSEEEIFDIPFVNSNRLNPFPFGSPPLIPVIKKLVYGDTNFSEDSLDFPIRASSTIYIPDLKTIETYKINDKRQTFLYKHMLDTFLKKGELSEDYKYDKTFNPFHVNKETGSYYFTL